MTDYSQLTTRELLDLQQKNESTLWNAKHGDPRIYTPEVKRRAQLVVSECNEELAKRGKK